MTCKVCSYINDVYAVRCVGCGNLLNEKLNEQATSKEKAIKIETSSTIDVALKDIKNAWVAGVVSGVLTLGVTLFAMSGYKYLSFDAFSLIDVALTLGLAFGIYKKNRGCAVFMFVYFLFSKYMIITESGSLSSLPLSMVFIYYYFRGVLGTYNYHKIKNV
jgi:hypothetical protein